MSADPSALTAAAEVVPWCIAKVQIWPKGQRRQNLHKAPTRQASCGPGAGCTCSMIMSTQHELLNLQLHMLMDSKQVNYRTSSLIFASRHQRHACFVPGAALLCNKIMAPEHATVQKAGTMAPRGEARVARKLQIRAPT